MKAILMSIQPKWVAKILNGEKTIEVRKRFPLNYRGWVYIYVTKGKHNLVKPRFYDKYLLFTKGALNIAKEESINGKVVARFYCDNVEEIKLERVNDYSYNTFEYMTETLTENELLKLSCLREYELNNYLTGNGYAIHISQLEIFDKPKELSEFYKIGHYEDFNDYFTDEKRINGKWCIPLTKAPQSMMYIEVVE